MALNRDQRKRLAGFLTGAAVVEFAVTASDKTHDVWERGGGIIVTVILVAWAIWIERTQKGRKR